MMHEAISRRALLAGLAAVTAAPRLSAQETALSVPWMGWPEEQVRPLMAAFEAANPAIRVREERLPLGELLKTLEVRLAARNATPDVYIVDGPLTASYAARGHLVDLGPVLAAEKDRFLPSALAQGSFEGKLYSSPIATSSQLLFYNRKLLADAGVAAPSADPAQRLTWEALLPMAQKLTNAGSGVFGFSFENSSRPYQILAVPQSWGAPVLGPDGLTATGYVDGPGMVASLTWYQQLFTTHKVSPANVFDNGVIQQMFGAGKIAMVLGGTWNLEGFEKAGVDFGVAPHPYFAAGKPVTPTGSFHVGINPRTRNAAQAQAFVKWLAITPAMELWLDLRPYPPVLKEVWEKRSKTTFAAPAWQIVQHELVHTATPRPATPGYREYEDYLRLALQDMQGGAAVQPTLAAAARNIDREMRKYR